MIPVSDSVRSRTTPYVNVAFITLNVLVFLYQLTLSTAYTNQIGQFFAFSELDRFFLDWGARPTCLAEFFGLTNELNPRTVLVPCPEGSHLLATPVTSMFLHGGWLHLIGNMIFLWVFGDNVEDAMGHARYAVFYILVGLIAGATHVFVNQDDVIPTIGASGAVAGVLGAYLLLFPRATVSAVFPILIIVWLPFRFPAAFLILLWFLLQVFSGVASLTASDVIGGTAWFAHIGGFVAGLVLVRLFVAGRRRPNLRVVHMR